MMSNNDLELIAAGFTAILGFKVVHGPPGQGLPKLTSVTMRNLFDCTYIPRALTNFSAKEVFEVHVMSIVGTTTTVKVTGTYTIVELKAAVEIKANIPGKDQRLMFNKCLTKKRKKNEKNDETYPMWLIVKKVSN